MSNDLRKFVWGLVLFVISIYIILQSTSLLVLDKYAGYFILKLILHIMGWFGLIISLNVIARHLGNK